MNARTGLQLALIPTSPKKAPLPGGGWRGQVRGDRPWGGRRGGGRSLELSEQRALMGRVSDPARKMLVENTKKELAAAFFERRLILGAV